MRDSPPTDVAAWVSASDKPSAIAKMPAGDLNEKRLKKEVMAISARERRRIKEVPTAVCVPLMFLRKLIILTRTARGCRGHAR